jgi:hypothetical protein
MQDLRHKAFHYVVALAVAAGVGGIRPGSRLLQIPEDLVSEVVEAVGENEPEWSKDDRRRVLSVLASDPRSLVRIRVAEAAGALMPDFVTDAEKLLRGLANDHTPSVRAAAARGLELVLARATPIDRVELVCQWAASGRVAEREAVARSLRARVQTLVTDLVIEQLSRDGSAAVRLAALRAAAHHFDEHPRAYREVAERLTADKSRRVRRVARQLMAEFA